MSEALKEITTADVRLQPYWWDRAPPTPQPAVALAPRYDVAIVGSGYTGLRAALELARAGRSVIVLDREDPGFGAARRNAGYLGRTLKHSVEKLIKTRGRDHALALYRELGEAFNGIIAFIGEERIDCHLTRPGRFIAATSPKHYAQLEADLEGLRRHLGYEYAMVPKDKVRTEFASDVYVGGAVIPDLASIHPGLYHKGLLERVLAAGAVVAGQTEALSIARHPGDDRVEVLTAHGRILARDAIIATNGYTPGALSWHARRVIPFEAYMAATEELGERARATIPNNRTVLDTNMNIDWFRLAPDSPRLLFGGATGSGMKDTARIAGRLHAILARVLPQHRAVKISHLWTGYCAGTFDLMPHIGGRDGIWHGLGYNFAGVPMGTHFGRKLAQLILGRPEGRSAFAEDRFPTFPLYRGRPWFVPLAMRYYDWKDGKRA
ncbi:MAG TPA: FAD-binding oxidoreductase [Kiloniellales bacterium]|nr:FAD-binding oxidoreductase [Kiloniellales bacterium]